jgi:hypothetical protein
VLKRVNGLCNIRIIYVKKPFRSLPARGATKSAHTIHALFAIVDLVVSLVENSYLAHRAVLDIMMNEKHEKITTSSFSWMSLKATKTSTALTLNTDYDGPLTE